MTKASLVIVGHPSRQDMIDKLSAQVRPDCLAMDTTGIGCGRNHIRAIQQAYGHAVEHYRDWILVLEDDAVPVEKFRTHVEGSLRFAPTSMVSFYLGINHPQQYQYNFSKAVKEDVRWIVHTHMRHAVAYAVRLSLVPKMLERMIHFDGMRWAPDDAMSEFAKENNELIAYTNPSIVDHQDLPSIIKNRHHMGFPVLGRPLKRKAHRFGVPRYWDSSYTTVKVP